MKKNNFINKWLDENQDPEIEAKVKAEAEQKYKAMTCDKILSMTDEFVQSNRSEGQTYAHYHYDMMADFALHILETFNTKEK